MTKQTIHRLDYIRSFAIFTVVLIHATHIVQQSAELDPLSISVFFGIGRLGVPIFFMLTGYLMLNRSYENEFGEGSNYFKRRLLPLLLKCFFGSIVLSLFDMYVNQYFSIWILIRQVVYIQYLPGMQVWYIPVIVLIYYLLPSIALVFNQYSTKFLLLSMLPIVLYIAILNDINVWLTRSNQTAFYHQFLINDLFIYIAYIIVGGLIKREVNRSLNLCILFLSSVFFFGCLVGLQMYALDRAQPFDPWYNSFLVFAISISIFVFLIKVPLFNNKLNLISLISKTSFGIYWIHTIVLYFLGDKLFFISNYQYRIVCITILTILICSILVGIGHRFVFGFKKIKDNIFRMQDL